MSERERLYIALEGRAIIRCILLKSVEVRFSAPLDHFRKRHKQA
ncbi:MAG: hypothetical protein ACTSYD_10370 [Candidatus Heimdallarchaeaceae archaeon]